jgi:hypothetical protein
MRKLTVLLVLGALMGACAAPASADDSDFKSGFYAVAFDPSSPAFTWFSVDSIGRGDLAVNAAQTAGRTNGPLALGRGAQGRFFYVFGAREKKAKPVWEIALAEKEMTLRSRYVQGAPSPPFTLTIDQKKNHATLLGLMNQDGSVKLPAILHLPDQGSWRISSAQAVSLGYEATNRAGNVKITFKSATPENPVVKYNWEVVAICPKVAGIEGDARFDGFRRNWLNIFQMNPQRRMLANHASSDTCAFCFYEYADVARRTPPLAHGLSALDLVRQSLDGIISGARAYGMPGHGDFVGFSLDTYPSLLIAAHDCVADGQDSRWLAANYAHFKSWADKLLATDTNADGLVKYSLSGNSGIWPGGFPKVRPANWWDTIGFGHDDAYANALAYRALGDMEQMARRLGQTEDATHYHAAAEKLREAYFKTFFNPATGVLGGWRSSDGELHDYYFLYVNGIAIHYGLVPPDKANGIMDALMAKIREVGYTQFDMGLPGNLITVALKDYVHRTPDGRFGGGVRQDNKDGFQKYENGAATGCFAYFTLAALYDLGRMEEGDRILMPMLRGFAMGDFQGFGANGMSKDWRAWDGTCSGYEGFLTDNYYALLAVLDRQAAITRGGNAVPGR